MTDTDDAAPGRTATPPSARTLLAQPLIRLLAINLAFGLLIAVIAVAGLIALDAHHLRRLVLSDSSPVIAIGLLLFGFAVTMGSWVMGSAVMRLGDRDAGDGDRGNRGHRVHRVRPTADDRPGAPVPIPVRVRGRLR
ncbi:hypothetical protein A33M_0625 [Rhodovulum sp. PH10]|uniref:hypothetical protein n=1 Tax=Rhodovulum sp. PH10 TaxID=1187851 RepID=UPI00027C2738|nr:hypothetical protein [Rhodovulum sp. PH10]EJW13133.1 hypothetical protein A33M_0625 [Rhodovulum sp. PH10]